MKAIITIILLCMSITNCLAYNTYNSVELFRSYGKQQIRTQDSKGNKIVVTPHYSSYKDRNENVTEKIVAIYDKHAPNGTYGARYVIYKPIGNYIGYHRISQSSPNGYGYTPIWDGGPGSDTPCFPTVCEAIKHYYPTYTGRACKNKK